LPITRFSTSSMASPPVLSDIWFRLRTPGMLLA
jgi:hypothetical protein